MVLLAFAHVKLHWLPFLLEQRLTLIFLSHLLQVSILLVFDVIYLGHLATADQNIIILLLDVHFYFIFFVKFKRVSQINLFRWLTLVVLPIVQLCAPNYVIILHR